MRSVITTGERPASLLAFVSQFDFDADVLKKPQQIVETSSWEGDVFREQLSTRDDARLAKRRQAHCLCRIELRVLECSQPCDAVHQDWWEVRPVDVDLITQHDLNEFGKHALDRWFFAAAGR